MRRRLLSGKIKEKGPLYPFMDIESTQSCLNTLTVTNGNHIAVTRPYNMQSIFALVTTDSYEFSYGYDILDSYSNIAFSFAAGDELKLVITPTHIDGNISTSKDYLKLGFLKPNLHPLSNDEDNAVIEHVYELLSLNYDKIEVTKTLTEAADTIGFCFAFKNSKNALKAFSFSVEFYVNGVRWI
ncbi:MAG: hypothetical protein IJO00_01970 [Clostridia bacterium]|nr:hypothetical protein [Clostridia bacterium]